MRDTTRLTREFLEAVVAGTHPLPPTIPQAPGWAWHGHPRPDAAPGESPLHLTPEGEEVRQELEARAAGRGMAYDLTDDLITFGRAQGYLARIEQHADEAVSFVAKKALEALLKARKVALLLAVEQVEREELYAEWTATRLERDEMRRERDEARRERDALRVALREALIREVSALDDGDEIDIGISGTSRMSAGGMITLLKGLGRHWPTDRLIAVADQIAEQVESCTACSRPTTRLEESGLAYHLCSACKGMP